MRLDRETKLAEPNIMPLTTGKLKTGTLADAAKKVKFRYGKKAKKQRQEEIKRQQRAAANAEKSKVKKGRHEKEKAARIKASKERDAERLQKLTAGLVRRQIVRGLAKETGGATGEFGEIALTEDQQTLSLKFFGARWDLMDEAVTAATAPGGFVFTAFEDARQEWVTGEPYGDIGLSTEEEDHFLTEEQKVIWEDELSLPIEERTFPNISSVSGDKVWITDVGTSAMLALADWMGRLETLINEYLDGGGNEALATEWAKVKRWKVAGGRPGRSGA